MAVNPGGLSLGVTRKGYQVRERWNLSPTCFSSRHRSTVRLVHLKGNILNHRGDFFFFFFGVDFVIVGGGCPYLKSGH